MRIPPEEIAWYVLYAKSRHEKLVDELLRKKGLESFLPLRKIQRQWSDRVKQIEEPLFKGYLFVRTAFADRLTVLQTKGVVRFIGFDSFPEPVPGKVIFALRRFMEEEIAVDPFPYLKEGDAVIVKEGLFRGVEGFLVHKKGKYRLVVSLDHIQQAASIELDAASVEKIN